MENNLRVSKSKGLVEAHYRLSLEEKRIIQYAITKVNPTKHINGYMYYFNVIDFAQCYNLNEKACYNRMKTVLERLYQRTFSYNCNNKGYKYDCRLIASKAYNDNKGSVGVKFSDEMQHELTRDKDFLSYAIRHTVAFSSASAMRIYEIILYQLQRCPVKKLTKRIKIIELKEILGLIDNYDRFADFKIRVLEPAKKQINKHSDIRINYEVVKDGRVPHLIKFTAWYKKETTVKKDKNTALGTNEIQNELVIEECIDKKTINNSSPVEKEKLKLDDEQLKFISYAAKNNDISADTLINECISRNKLDISLSELIMESVNSIKECS